MASEQKYGRDDGDDDDADGASGDGRDGDDVDAANAAYDSEDDPIDRVYGKCGGWALGDRKCAEPADSPRRCSQCRRKACGVWHVLHQCATCSRYLCAAHSYGCDVCDDYHCTTCHPHNFKG